MVLAGALVGGCFDGYVAPHHTGSLGGQVVLSGPVRGASITVDQLNRHTGAIYQHVGEARTDEHGRFQIDETSEANGLFRIVSRGGAFEDLATGATIQLDATDELHTLIWFPILERREDALVSPIGHFVEARARAELERLGDMTAAVEAARRSLHRHFGNADWTLLELADLAQHQQSPTEPVRAAFVHAALSFLVKDIAASAGASPQQVNVFTLVQQWTTDLVRAREDDPALFDGNDGNDRSPGSGLQLGHCDPAPPDCVTPPDACEATGHCRALCDLFAGTPRALLAGAMTKVIRDTGEGGVNQTGLRIEDTLAVARAVADNTDPELFGAACRENLDRTPPEVRWDDAVSPGADAVVRAVVTLKAIGVDDVDLQPRTEIVGVPDADGDPTNNVAVAVIDTRGLADGGLTVTARSTDLAGNHTSVERRVVVDNTPPQLTVAPADFFVDSLTSTWWTMHAAPTLSGTLVEAHPATVHALVGAAQVTGTITGPAWSVVLPAGSIDAAGANVTIRVTDRAGNVGERTQRIRYDGTAPVLTIPTSTVTDEATETPSFSTDESPIHTHDGTPTDLSVVGACPALTKYSYLLGAASPPYVTESPSRNPIAYRLVSSDDGVGIVDGSTQYRVLRRGASGPTVVLPWTSTGTGAPLGEGARLFEVAIVSDLVAELATTEATYDVELRATDRLSRTATTSRCFTLQLKAPPLHAGLGGPTSGHTFALNSLSLAPGASFDLVAARLLNNNATGASLIDQPFSNGTTETVYLTVTVTRPTSVTATQAFVIRNYSSTTAVNIDCGDPEDPNPACEPPAPFPVGGGYSSGPISTPATTLTFPVKLYELNAAGVPTIEVPCLAPCSASGAVFTFAVPPRPPGGAPARRFLAMTMIGQVSNLWPRDVNQSAAPPFLDSSVDGVRFTGKQPFSSSGCTRFSSNFQRCQERTSRTQYRALTRASLEFASATISTYATSPSAQGSRLIVGDALRGRTVGWSTMEGTLP